MSTDSNPSVTSVPPVVTGSRQALESMTLTQLKDIARGLAKDKKMGAFSQLRKNHLIEALLKAQTPSPEASTEPARPKTREEELNSMRLPELKTLAKQMNILGYSTKNKATLVQMILDREAPRASNGSEVTAAPLTDRERFQNMTVIALKDYARNHQIQGYSTLRKEPLIELIMKARTTSAPAPSAGVLPVAVPVEPAPQ